MLAVAQGVRRFDAIVPDSLNTRAIEEMRALMPVKVAQVLGKPAAHGGSSRPASMTPLSRC